MVYSVFIGALYSKDDMEGVYSYIIKAGDVIVFRYYERVVYETQNRCDIIAAISGVKRLFQRFPDIRKADEVLIYSDSMYLLNTLNGMWKRKENRDLFKIWDEVWDNGNNAKYMFLHAQYDDKDKLCEECIKMCVDYLGYDPRK